MQAFLGELFGTATLILLGNGVVDRSTDEYEIGVRHVALDAVQRVGYLRVTLPLGEHGGHADEPPLVGDPQLIVNPLGG